MLRCFHESIHNVSFYHKDSKKPVKLHSFSSSFSENPLDLTLKEKFYSYMALCYIRLHCFQVRQTVRDQQHQYNYSRLYFSFSVHYHTATETNSTSNCEKIKLHFSFSVRSAGSRIHAYHVHQ